MPFLCDCLRLPNGAEEVSQILHGFVTGIVNILWIYATNAAGFAGLDLQDCLVSFALYGCMKLISLEYNSPSSCKPDIRLPGCLHGPSERCDKLFSSYVGLHTLIPIIVLEEY